MALLETYSGPWTDREAAHLLRRVCFGASQQQIKAATAAGLNATVTLLLTEKPLPIEPLDPETGKPFLQKEDKGRINYFTQVLKTWWVDHMCTDEPSAIEKLTLVWSNHYSTEQRFIQFAQHSQRLLTHFRSHALGNMKELTNLVTTEAAMLRYLDGTVNTKTSPNENYARELQELFTIGKGPEALPGNYTHYSEHDVRTAAKVLTGWTEDLATNIVHYVEAEHDESDKTFSECYGGRVIKGRTGPNGAQEELNELLDMIFEQKETARRYVRTLYRWFVKGKIDATTEAEVIEPLAEIMRTNNYNVGPVMKKLLLSKHFFGNDMIGGLVKSPADFVVGWYRNSGMKAPTDIKERHSIFTGLCLRMAEMQMDLNDPPNVAGWPALYSEPHLHRLWLTTATLPLRNQTTDWIITDHVGLGGLKFNSVEFTKTIANAQDAYALVDAINKIFFALPFVTATRERLVNEVLLGFDPVYEWTKQWTEFINQPDSERTKAIKAKLDKLYIYVFRMAEFQLV